MSNIHLSGGWEDAYLDIIHQLLTKGDDRMDRTGVGTTAMFGAFLKVDLTKDFPLLTTKYLPFKKMVHELLWFLRGDTNIAYLHANDVHIWDAWADENGDLGPIYGKQWTAWEAKDGRVINQIDEVIDQIVNNPTSRRMLFTGWNVGELDKMALPPCHMTYQFFVREDRFLDVLMYQRSADIFLGVPWNIAETALLTHILAFICGNKRGKDLIPGELHWTGGDTHLYHNHQPQARELLRREPLTPPTLSIRGRKRDQLEGFGIEDVQLVNYEYHPSISAEIAV